MIQLGYTYFRDSNKDKTGYSLSFAMERQQIVYYRVELGVNKWYTKWNESYVTLIAQSTYETKVHL